MLPLALFMGCGVVERCFEMALPTQISILFPPRVINCQTHQDGAEVELPQVRFERGLDEAEGDGRAEDAVGAQRD